jgi:diadenosine tetraphosphate (Ap4A) HIT family hydrolase
MYKNYLWADSRSRWVKNPYKGCLFCGIAKGDPKIPKKILYKDKDMMVLMNIFPYNVGHLQVVPIRHVIHLEELRKKEFEKFFRMTKNSVKLLKRVLNPKGFNIGMNIGGEIAGASVKHLHIQIVPRYGRDAGFMEIISHAKVMPESLEKTYENLMKHVNILKE